MSRWKVLQVGCGGISHAWLDSFTQRDDIEIIGLVDLNEAVAMEQRNKYQLSCPVYTDFEMAIQQLNPQIVVDNTIPEVHHRVVTTALQHGCYVLGEKPLSNSMEHAIDMVKIADQTGKTYSVMQNYRNNPNVRAYRNLIETGHIGQLGFLTANFFLGARFSGFRESMTHPLIIDMSIHTFDLARMISGSDPVSVYCHEFNPAGSWAKGDISASCIFEMTNGVVFTYNGSWFSIGENMSWSAQWRALGSKGTALWDGENSPIYDAEKPSAEKTFHYEFERHTYSYSWSGIPGHAGGIDEMIKAIKENRRAETDCHDNIKSLAMVLGAIRSSQEGRKVMIHELIGDMTSS